MSFSDVFRDRHYTPGYVYIAGSLDGGVLKIGTSKAPSRQAYNNRYQKYGGYEDWRLLYSVWIDAAGKIEHEARARLQSYKVMGTYKKNGFSQKAREMVRCSFSIALDALNASIAPGAGRDIWQSDRCRLYEFGREKTVAELISAPTVLLSLILCRKVQELDLSSRSVNCLRNVGVVYVGELVQQTESELLRTPNLGRKSTGEIKERLHELGLHLGLEVLGWPPKNLVELSALADHSMTKIEDLGLSVATIVPLRKENLVEIKHLVRKTACELLDVPNFGTTELDEVAGVLESLGLRLGMEVPD